MSIIAAGTTTTTALSSTGNTDGTLQLQVNGTTPSVTLNTLGAIGVGSTPSYGTAGQVLTSGGSTTAPTWTTVGGGSAATPTALGTVYGKQTTSGGTPYLTAIGYNAGGYTTGVGVTAVGTEALYTNSAGARSTAMGYRAGYSNTGDNNLFVGNQSGFTNTTGTANSFVGGMTSANWPPGYYNETGSGNTYIGSGAGYTTTTGAKNTIVGSYSGNQDGLDIRTASNYAVISDGDGNRQITMKEGQTLALDSAVPNSGTGITFPATQSASSDANTLDDYEEGTWTCAITTGGGSITMNTSFDTGAYTKVGRLVTITGEFRVSSVSSPSGTAIIALPFTAAAATERSTYATTSLWMENASQNMNTYFMQIAPSTTNMYIYAMGTNSYANAANNFSGDELLFISVTYMST